MAIEGAELPLEEGGKTASDELPLCTGHQLFLLYRGAMRGNTNETSRRRVNHQP